MTIEQLKSRSLENICTKGNVFVAANRATRLPANVKNDEVANVRAVGVVGVSFHL